MSTLGDCAVEIARRERQYRDSGYTGLVDNRSPRVDVYLSYVGHLPADPNRQGQKWCGHFVRWCYHEAARLCGRSFSLPSAVSGAPSLRDYAVRHPDWIVWQSGDPVCPVQAGDIFINASLRHVGMVSTTQTTGHSFRSIEGNMTDAAHSHLNDEGIQELRHPFTGCAMIVRPPGA